MEEFSYHNPALYLAERERSLRIFLTEEDLGVTLAHTYDRDDCDDVVSIYIILEDIDAVIKTLKTMKIELQDRKAQMLEHKLEYVTLFTDTD